MIIETQLSSKFLHQLISHGDQHWYRYDVIHSSKCVTPLEGSNIVQFIQVSIHMIRGREAPFGTVS